MAGKPTDGDDDAAAVMWTGMFLCCATKALTTDPPKALVEYNHDLAKAFHRLWGLAASDMAYDKDQWLKLQSLLGL